MKINSAFLSYNFLQIFLEIPKQWYKTNLFTISQGNIFLYQKILKIFKKIFKLQKDIITGTLTVRENLWFCANMRLPMSVSQESKAKVIEEALNDLGLNDCADTKVIRTYILLSCASIFLISYKILRYKKVSVCLSKFSKYRIMIFRLELILFEECLVAKRRELV